MSSGHHLSTRMIHVACMFIFILLVACAAPPAVQQPADQAAGLRETPLVTEAGQVSGSAPVSADPAGPQAAPMLTGAEILSSLCARCHLPALLEQIEKPRAEWEAILERMAGQGVQLSEPEKDILLDYLAAAD
jgi:hypothetical protein